MSEVIFISDILDKLGEIAGGVTEFIANIFNGLVKVFYASPDGTAPAELTFLGYLLLIVVVMAFAKYALGIIMRIIKLRG
jgi:hypothetical protein